MPESKKLFVFVTDKIKKRNPYSEGVEFYAFPEEDSIIPVKNEITCPPEISQPLFDSNHIHPGESYASLNGRVYRVGGLRVDCYTCWPLCDALRKSKTVYCWDAINNCWASSSEMNVAHNNLHVCKGKLYATGGSISAAKDIKEAFIEMFDEEKRCWTVLPLPHPRVKLDLHQFLCAAVDSKGFILFASMASECFYAFYPPKKWKRMSELRCPIILFDHSLYSLTVTENHLFWLKCHGWTLIGFDHNDGRCFEIDLVLEGVFPGDRSVYGFPILVYAGNGVLALVWQGAELRTDIYNCSRFSVDYVNGDPKLKLLSRQNCVVPNNRMRALLDAFTVDLDVPVGNPSLTGVC